MLRSFRVIEYETCAECRQHTTKVLKKGLALPTCKYACIFRSSRVIGAASVSFFNFAATFFFGFDAAFNAFASAPLAAFVDVFFAFGCAGGDVDFFVLPPLPSF
jgi:hypothetical protein